jgi:putative GTP pyrophosphokinase
MSSRILSRSQLEKLGDRLRDGLLTLIDLRQLRAFLQTLEPFAEETFSQIRDLETDAEGLQFAQTTRRNVKTTRSIIAKLRRQTTKLVQIQDLVGCRIVVPDIIDQNEWLDALTRLFPRAEVVDRRGRPQNGYRAVHVIVRDNGYRFEVQLRSVLQDRWANVVEKIADRHGIDIKYGGGNAAIQGWLREISLNIAKVESAEERCGVTPEVWSLPGTYGMRLFGLFSISGEPDVSAPRTAGRGPVAVRSLIPLDKDMPVLVGKRRSGEVERGRVEDVERLTRDPFDPTSDTGIYCCVLAFDRGDEAASKYWDIWEEAGPLSQLEPEIMAKLRAAEEAFE